MKTYAVVFMDVIHYKVKQGRLACRGRAYLYHLLENIDGSKPDRDLENIFRDALEASKNYHDRSTHLDLPTGARAKQSVHLHLCLHGGHKSHWRAYPEA